MPVDVEWIARGATLAEGPRLAADGTLYYGDVLGTGLMQVAPDGAVDDLLPGRRNVGGIVLDEDGGVICSGRDGLLRLDPATGATREVPVVIDSKMIRGINDIEADAAGNVYGGTLDFAAFDEGRAPAPGIVFRLDTDGSATKLAEMPVPNGMDFGDADGRLYLSESGDGIYSYAIAADGTLSDRRCHGLVPDSDGIVLDAAGGIWVARYLCNLLQYHPAGGGEPLVLEMPFASVASVTFGGPDLNWLYIAGGDLKTPGIGGMIRMRVDQPGLAPRLARIGA